MQGMKHEFRLMPDSFEKIESGTKTVEARLHDAKRRTVGVGDTIVFRSHDGRALRATVTELVPRPTFRELFAAVTPEAIGHASQEEWRELYAYYAPDDESALGVLGIRIGDVRPLPDGMIE